MADSSHVDSNIVTTATDSTGATVVAVVQSNVTESSRVDSVITTGGKGEPGDPATNLVTSVNGKQGAVVLDASDIGADIAGAAAQALSDANDYTDQEVAGINTGVLSVVAGTNVTVDNTDPKNPIVSATGGGAVNSVNGQTGTVILDTDDIADTPSNRYTNDTDIARLANTSGTNTGDQDLSGYALTSSLANVATSGDYDDLANKPIIPTALDDLSGDSDDVAEGSTNLYMTSLERSKLSGIEAGAEVNTVDSVAGKTGAVTLGSADLTATGGTSTSFLRKDNTWATPANTTYSEISTAEIDAGTASTSRTISGRRSQYIVDKARNGVTLNADTSLAGNAYFLDEDDMASNSDTKVPSQQSVKAYVDNKPGIPKTFNLGTHPFFSSVSNTTTETDLNIFTLPANTIENNFLVSFNLTGAVTNTSGSTVTYTYRVKFGSLIWSVFSFDIPTGSTNVPFKANIEAICVDFGGLRLAGGGTINVSSGAAGTNDAIIRTVPSSIDAIALTTDVPITLTVQMSLANADASIAAYSSTISVVNPAPAA